MEHKVSPKLYGKYLTLLKPEVYSKIVAIRRQFDIPVYGIIPSTIAPRNAPLLLNILASSTYLEGRISEFDKLVKSLIKKYHLLPAHTKFVKLFIFYDVGVPYYTGIYGLDRFDTKQPVQRNVEITLTIKYDLNTKEWNDIYKMYVKPLLDGSKKFKELHATKKEHFRIYYWLVLRGMTAKQYLEKFHREIKPIRKTHQDRINGIRYDMEEKIKNF